MQLKTFTMNRVFRVARHEWKSRKWTEFGFDTPERAAYSGRVVGHPLLRETMHVTVAMPRPDAWSEMYGWYDHVDRSIQIESSHPDFGYVMATLVSMGMVVNAMFVGHAQGSKRMVAGFAVMLVPVLLLGLFFGQRLLRKYVAKMRLRELFPDARIVSS